MSLIDTPPAFTREMKRKAIDREIAQRKRVYPRLVDERKMTISKAEYEIAVMEAIAKDYAP